MQKRILSMALAAFLLLGCLTLAVGVSADGGEPAPGWDGTTATAPTLGSGSTSNPYRIASAENLAWVSEMAKTDTLNAKNFILTADVDLGGREWTPIGTGKEFQGSFDGDYHTVSNFKVTNTALSASGLFGTIRSATVCNLTVANATVTGGSGSQGAVVGVANKGTLIRCTANADVTVTGAGFAGGIVGSLNGECTVTACVNRAAVSAEGSNVRVGGIAGIANAASNLSLCVNHGALNGTGASTSGVRVGGILGQTAAVRLSDCVNYGTVTAYGYAGGLSGYCNAAGGSYTNCASVGTVASTYYATVAGALSGYLNGETAFNECYYTADANAATVGSNSSAGMAAGSTVILAADAPVEGKDTTTLDDMNALLEGIAERIGPTVTPRQKPDAPTEWTTGEIAFAFAGGTGLYNDPYRIATAGQLAFLAGKVNSGESFRDRFFALENDIDLGGKYWDPIGMNVEKSFRGIFNGKGHTVSNFTVSLTDDGATVCGGLFGSVNEGVVKNVGVDLFEIEVHGVKSYAGGVVGLAVASRIAACETGANGLVSYPGTEESREVVAGGIVGRAEGSTVTDCVNRAQVYAYKATPSAYAGGIAALGADSTVSYCVNYGRVTVASDGGGRFDCGGIVGTLGVKDGAAGKVDHCVNYGTVISGQHGGGLVAYAQTAFCEITDSYSRGAVSANHQWSGLLLGRWDLYFITMDRCGYLVQTDPEPSKIGHMRWVLHPVAVRDEKGNGSAGNILGTFTGMDEAEFEAAAAPILAAVEEHTATSVAAEETEVEPHHGGDDPAPGATTTLNRDIPVKPGRNETVTTADADTETSAQTAEGKKAKKGCGSVIAGGLAVLLAVLPAAALCARKKKD